MKMSRASLVALCLLPIAASTAAGGGDARRADATASVTLDGAVIRNPRTVEVHVGASVQTATDRTGVAVRRAGAATAEVRFAASVGAAAPIWQRLSDSLGGKALRPIGASVVTAAGEYLLRDATVTEVAFPALDAADNAALAVSFTLAASDVKRGTGALAKAPRATRAPEPLRSGFRLTVGDLDTTRVQRIDAFSFKVSAQRASDKTGRVVQVAGPVTLPALTIYLDAGAPGLDGWLSWIGDVAAGKAMNRSGRLELVAPGAKEAAFSLELHDVGISAIHDVVNGQRRQLKVDLFIGRAAIGAGATPAATR